MSNPADLPETRTDTDRLLVGALLMVGAATAYWGDGITRWLGTAVLLGSAWEARFVAPRRFARAARWLPAAIVLVAFVWLFWELLLGHPPASRDHGIHYFQTRLLWDSFLPEGTVWGWSERLGAGYPFGESYPVLGYVLGGLPHALSAGAIPPRVSYAWGIAATWALGTVAIGWLAHTLMSALRPEDSSTPRWAGCVAALLWLFDAGASRQGGWNYVMFHGVWPQMFSAVLWTLSLPLTMRALQTPRWRSIAAASLALGASVMAHPFGMLAAAASAGLLLVALILFPKDTHAPVRTWVLIHLGSGAVAASTVVVFFGSAGAMARSPVQWSPLGQLSHEAVTQGLFATHWAWLGPVALLGVFAVARKPNLQGAWIVALAAALVVLGSHESMTVLRLDLLVAGFKNLQFPRYSIELKPLLFALGGVGGALLPTALRGVTASAPSRTTAWTLACVLAPFAATFSHDIDRLRTRPVGALDTLEANPQHSDDLALTRVLREEAERLDGRPRVAFLRSGMGGGMFPLFAITDADADLVLDGHIAAVNFKHRIRRQPEGYDALGVTHVIYDREIDDEAFVGRLEELGRFGRHRIARYTPERSKLEADTTRGVVTVQRNDPEVVVIDVESDQTTTVVIGRAPHVRWNATFDGDPIELEEMRRIRGITLIGVRVPESGRLTLTYGRTRAERLAGWLTLGAWLLGFVFLTQTRMLSARRKRQWRWPTFVRPVLAAGLVCATVLVFVVQDRKLQRTWQAFAADKAYRSAAGPDDDGASEDELPRLIRDLVDDGDVRFERSPARVCNGLAGKDVLSGCSEAEHAPVRATTYRAPYLYRCLEFGIPPGGSVTLTLGNGSHDVLGRLTRRLLGSPGRNITFGVGQVPKAKQLRADNIDFFVAARTPGRPVVAELHNGGRHMERFCLAAAEVEAP